MDVEIVNNNDVHPQHTTRYNYLKTEPRTDSYSKGEAP